MAIQNKINLETRFQLNTTPNEIIYEKDITDYSSEGIALSDVKGSLKITSPIGTVFHNTVPPAFDIDPNIQDYIDTIALPTDSNGDPLKGIYVVEYTIVVTGGVQPGTYIKEFKYNYCYEEIIPDVDITIDLICSKLTSTDNTPYPIELTSNTLTHTIFPPLGLDAVAYPPNIVSTVVNTYSPITTNNWTAVISNILELTFPATGDYSEHIIDVTIKGNDEKNIKDDINICNLQCNMRSLTSRYSDALSKNPIDAVRIQNDQVTPAMLNAFMYTSNIACGNFEKAEFYYNEVLKYTGSSPDCACDSNETPTLILASCGGGGNSSTYVVDVCNTNSALSVTANTIGDETTYTLCFDDTVWVKINSLTETVITSNDNSVTIVPTLNGFTKTWDLSVVFPPASAGSVHVFSGLLDIDLTNKTASPTLSWRAGWSSVWGNKLQEPTIVNESPVFVDWSINRNCFYLEGYIDQSGGEFPKPQFQVVETLRRKITTIDCNTERNLEVLILQIDTSNDRIYFQLKDRFYSYQVVGGGLLTEQHDRITISVIINA